jgi:hypothetical protein
MEWRAKGEAGPNRLWAQETLGPRKAGPEAGWANLVGAQTVGPTHHGRRRARAVCGPASRAFKS